MQTEEGTGATRYPRNVSRGVVVSDVGHKGSLLTLPVVELLDLRMEDEHLDGTTEAEDVRSVLELIQSLTLEASEDLDAYQKRYSGS